jgi:hypothetical protein
VSKKTWPRIRQTVRHGKPKWEVDARINGKGDGRKFFDTKNEADGWARQQKNLRADHGKKAFGLDELAKHNLSPAVASTEACFLS